MALPEDASPLLRTRFHHRNALAHRRHLAKDLHLVIRTQSGKLRTHLRPESIQRLHHSIVLNLALPLQRFQLCRVGLQIGCDQILNYLPHSRNDIGHIPCLSPQL